MQVDYFRGTERPGDRGDSCGMQPEMLNLFRGYIHMIKSKPSFAYLILGFTLLLSGSKPNCNHVEKACKPAPGG